MESGFQVTNIILLESSFSRVDQVVFAETVQNNMDIQNNVAVNGNAINVIQEVTVTQTYQEQEQVKIKVKMVGMFLRVGESQITDLQAFGSVNGAAIVFPFVREVIASMSLKAGIPAIILPPVNFTKAIVQRKPEETAENL